jgi:hypothetical protein
MVVVTCCGRSDRSGPDPVSLANLSAFSRAETNDLRPCTAITGPWEREDSPSIMTCHLMTHTSKQRGSNGSRFFWRAVSPRQIQQFVLVVGLAVFFIVRIAEGRNVVGMSIALFGDLVLAVIMIRYYARGGLPGDRGGQPFWRRDPPPD